MHLGMIGLGRMGASLVKRLAKDHHKCVVYDVKPAAVKKFTGLSSAELTFLPVERRSCTLLIISAVC